MQTVHLYNELLFSFGSLWI